MKYSHITLLLFLLLLASVPAQTVSLPLTNRAYDAVERWEVQGYINGVFNGSRPFTRQEMADSADQAPSVGTEADDAPPDLSLTRAA